MRTDSGNSELVGDQRRVRSTAAQRGAIVAPREASEPITGSPAHTRALRLSVLRPDPGVVVVRMRGEIDLAAVPRLTGLTDRFISRETTAEAVTELRRRC